MIFKNKNFNLFICSAFVVFTISSCANNLKTSANDEAVNQKLLTAVNANIELGMLHLQKGDTIEAKEQFIQALKYAPNYAPSWYSMAYYLEATGNYQKADEYFKQAIKIAPADGAVQNNYGTFLCHTGKVKQSIPHFVLATQDPNYLNPSAAYENAALCSLLISDRNQAEKYFKRAVMENPKATRSLIQLAKIEYQNQRYIEAKNLIDRASNLIKLNREDSLLRKKINSHIK